MYGTSEGQGEQPFDANDAPPSSVAFKSSYRLTGLRRSSSPPPADEPLLRAVTDVLVSKALRAAARLGVRDIALAGGVSANRELRSRLTAEGEAQGLRVFVPAHALTTDNAAMVAQLAFMRHEAGATGTLLAPAFARISGTMRHAST